MTDVTVDPSVAMVTTSGPKLAFSLQTQLILLMDFCSSFHHDVCTTTVCLYTVNACTRVLTNIFFVFKKKGETQVIVLFVKRNSRIFPRRLQYYLL